MDEIATYIEPFYSPEDVQKIIEELSKYIETLPKYTKDKEDRDWYKNSNIYFIYPDALPDKSNPPLKNIKFFLPHIQELGCNAIHLLPFFESPMRDKGFDISNYYKVRENLGSMQELLNLKKETENLGMHVFIDVVFNHVSRDHEWFKKAESGDEFYRNFFIFTKEMPEYLGNINKGSRVFAEYLVNGERKLVTIAFPELTGTIPHWVQGKDWYWYYHTYYPHQLDVNWQNPYVFIEFAKILLFWASKGFNFRFDAIPFVGKSAYKMLDTHSPFTHTLVSVFKILAQKIYPNSAFILEVNEHIDSDILYFGTASLKQADLLYNFQMCEILWISIVEEKSMYIWEKLDEEKNIPQFGQWINFLRNHDEISFTSISQSLLSKVHKELFPLGKPFRKGFGLSGRTFSLLEKNENKFFMCYFLLSSLPGCLLFPYGDEFGKENIPIKELPLEEEMDTRNINRGILDNALITSVKGKTINTQLSKIFTTRLHLKDFFQKWPKEIKTQTEIFSAQYSFKNEELVIFINLANKHVEVPFNASTYQKILEVGSVSVENGKIILNSYSGIWFKK